MIDALIAGRVYGTPTERTANNGNRFATAKVRVATKDNQTMWVNVVAFSAPTVRALLALSDGDSVALAGELTPQVWTDKEGNARPSLSLLAHGAMSAFHVQRKRKAAERISGELPFGDELLRGTGS